MTESLATASMSGIPGTADLLRRQGAGNRINTLFKLVVNSRRRKGQAPNHQASIKPIARSGSDINGLSEEAFQPKHGVDT
jgi:hypothetical protein